MLAITLTSDYFRPLAATMLASAILPGGFGPIHVFTPKELPSCDGQGDLRLWDFLVKMQAILRGLRLADLVAQETIVWVDADTLFLRECAGDLDRRLDGVDALFSDGGGSLNTGFFACRANSKMRAFWAKIAAESQWWQPGSWSGYEQDGASSHRHEIDFALLPREYWSPSLGSPMPVDARMIHLAGLAPAIKQEAMKSLLDLSRLDAAQRAEPLRELLKKWKIA